MSISFDAKSKKKDLKGTALKVAQAILALAARDAPGAMSALIEAVSAFQTRHSTIEQRAWDWWREIVAVALADVLRDPHTLSPLSSPERQKVIANFLLKVLQPDKAYTLDVASLLNPTAAPIYQPVRDAVPNLLRAAAPESPPDAATAHRKLDVALSRAAPRVYAARIDYYKPLVDALSGPVAEGARRDLAWQRHADWIRGLYFREPIFAQDEESGLSLAKVYVRLRCYHNEFPDVEIDEDDADRRLREIRAHVSWLHESVHTWLKGNQKAGNAIRIIAGGPGSGKSSFARAFACEVLDEGSHHVVFIPLQRMKLSADLRHDIGRFLRERWSEVDPTGGAGFPENPLDWRAQDPTPVLLVFDGLDELAKSEERAEELTSRFVARVFGELHVLNGEKLSVRALVLGRSVAAEAARREAELSSETLLHTLPLRPITRHDLSLPWASDQDDKDDIKDPHKLAKRDQRDQFWGRWQTATLEAAESTPPGVKDERLADLNGEPLLLYLLILSGYAAANEEQAADNRNRIYEAIFEKVFDRNKDKEHFATRKLDQEDFFILMECLGLATWIGGGRVGNDKDFHSLRDIYARERRQRFRTLEAADLRNVALQFYTRRDVGDSPGYEFIHKTFGEYLTARGLLYGAERLAKRLRNEELGEDCLDVAKAWLKMVGPAETTEEILQFLCDEARLITDERAVLVKDALAEILEYTLRNGFPAHDSAIETTWRAIENKQRCAEIANLAVLNAVARRLAENDATVDYAAIKLDWRERPREARRFLNRLHAKMGTISLSLLSHLNLSHVDLAKADLVNANLQGADLHEANLREAVLTSADLLEANLQEANLRRANFGAANLRRANLRKAYMGWANLCEANLFKADLCQAKLENADLSGADLRWANLSGASLFDSNLVHAKLNPAHLSGAQLIGAHLRDADLCSADLFKADLSKSDLSNTNLMGASLVGANLSQANCASVILRSAHVHFADLSGAIDLEQAQVDSALGNKKTKLPQGIKRPTHWVDSVDYHARRSAAIKFYSYRAR